MPFRILLAAAAFFVAVSAGCGDASNPLSGSDETARRDAAQALEAIEDLRSELEADVAGLHDELEAAEGGEESLIRRLEKLSDRLDRALARVQRRFEALGGSSRTAARSAESALSEARAVARELAVLDERLDYHLKNHRGG
jgi:DNA repair exonuclease SbcCD ATPase subunit